MPRYRFRALTRALVAVSGVIQGPDEGHCARLLQGVGLRPQSLRVVRIWEECGADLVSSWTNHDVTEVGLFVRQLATMLLAGIPLQRALGALANARSTSLGDVARFLEEGLLTGNRLSQVMAYFPQHFPASLLSLVRVGERSGQLAECLERGASLLEKERDLKRQVISALVYPAFILVSFSLLAILIGCFVLPRFGEVFVSLNQSLPLVVQWILGLFEFLSHPWVMGLCLETLVLAGVLVPLALRLERTQLMLDQFRLKLAPVREFLVGVALVRLSYTMTLLLESGIHLSEGLLLSADSCDSPTLAAALRRAHERIRKGLSLSDSLARESVFPSGYASMLAVAEETGTYVALLRSMQRIYEEETEVKIRTLLSLLEPFVVMLMGAVVGTFLMIMLLPMVRLFQNLGGM